MMGRARTLTTLAALFALAVVYTGCAREKRSERAAAEYGQLVSEAVALSVRIEPLRSSRIGMTGSDSLLFTFSDGEISEALSRLGGLEDRLTRSSVSSLSPRDVDNAEVIAYWLRGELFALREMQSFRYNPFLYSWMAEEALWGIPSRVGLPYPGELTAYRARLAKIPALLANARRLLDDPAETHTRFAAERLDSITASFGRLDSLTRERYGESITADLDAARRAIADFRRFVGDSLLARSHGKVILGSENLSKIFLYEELVNADPNMIMGKAESIMRKLKSLEASFEKRIEFEERGSLGRVRAAPETARPTRRAPAPPTPEPFDTEVYRILTELAGDSAGAGFGAGRVARLVIRYPTRTGYHSWLPKNISLTLPPPVEHPVEIFTTEPFAAPPCRAYGFFSREARDLSEDKLRARLLRATPHILEMDLRGCEDGDTLGAVFASETFRDGWYYLNTRELATDLRTPRPLLGRRLLEEEIVALARTVVVFRLHAGSMTSDDAAAYLVETTGMSPADAANEVLVASISPLVAYPGMAMVLVENMLETVAYVSGLDRPERKLLDSFRASRGMPLPVIAAKLSKD
jgi:hypothetical protein